MIGQLVQLPPNPPPLSWALCLLAAGVTVCVAVAFHLFVETPLLNGLRAFLKHRGPVEQRVSADMLARMGAPAEPPSDAGRS
jgi:peptidoglycan/LPS O-acetylase OafA/YrhL